MREAELWLARMRHDAGGPPAPGALARDRQSLTEQSLTGAGRTPIQRALFTRRRYEVRNSLKAAKVRDKNCRVVRRRGRVYVINKKNPRMKARQG